VGSPLYLPIFQKGGLIRTGDSHCLQGGGEVNLTALECSYKEIEIQPVVRKDLHIDWPRAETSTHWIFMGFDEDLNEAMKIAVRETVNFLAQQKMVPMSREEAYSLTSIVGDCRVSQMVDIRKGVHCIIPNTWPDFRQSFEYQRQPAQARLSLVVLKTENVADSLLVRARTGKIVKRALRGFDDMALDERRALSRSLFTALDAALPFENRPTREIILSEL
jgi:hypothetical protein